MNSEGQVLDLLDIGIEGFKPSLEITQSLSTFLDRCKASLCIVGELQNLSFSLGELCLESLEIILRVVVVSIEILQT
jgi:hypothetical protein